MSTGNSHRSLLTPSLAGSRFSEPEFELLCERLSELTVQIEPDADWPAHQQRLVIEAGVPGWTVPREFGGSEFSPEQMLTAYHELAAACLTTTFILTQQNGASQRIAASDNTALKSRLLPAIARGELFATVGISHLTTSRQHVARPVVTATKRGDEWILSGSVPWVTGAPHADYIVTGGTLDDGRQVLILLPTDLPGVQVGEPARLMALSASQTAPVELDHVVVPDGFCLAGPVAGVMKQGAAGPGSLTTSALACGHSSRAIARLQRESEQRPDLAPTADSLDAEWQALWQDLRSLVSMEGKPCTPGVASEGIRQRANSLVLRATQALLAASKGAGFIAGHPAERGVREAMFFLVWSCPQPVLAAALREFACLMET